MKGICEIFHATSNDASPRPTELTTKLRNSLRETLKNNNDSSLPTAISQLKIRQTPSPKRGKKNSIGTKSDKNESITCSAQAIISFCMENARADIATRILKRMVYKRNDFAQFYKCLNGEQLFNLTNSLKEFITNVVRCVNNTEKVRELSVQFGIDYVPRRSWGFKADYFSVMADALITEFVFLDGAIHQPTETIAAWVSLAELMFGYVRDGYYQQLRYLRKNDQSFNSFFTYSSQSSDCSTSEMEQKPQNKISRHERRMRSVPERRIQQDSSSQYMEPASSMDRFNIPISNRLAQLTASRRFNSFT